jgi:hypothetical protein
MNPEEMNGFWPTYSAWIGTPVIHLFVIRQCHIPIPCSIVGESLTAVRIQLQPEWEIDIPKELILAIEEATGRDVCMN